MNKKNLNKSEQCNFSDLSFQKYTDVILHDNILDILFKHKEEVHRKMIDLRGTFLIDHIAINIIDPNNKSVIFSITPSVEYNLIVQGLWKHDGGFSVMFQKNNNFYMWEKAYNQNYSNEIKQLKETKHGFTLGFNLSKNLERFNLIYSFATRSKNEGLFDYYSCHINELFMLGDYGYQSISNLYSSYCDLSFRLPSLISKQRYDKKTHLKLIVDNS
jgi:hypothetical protein